MGALDGSKMLQRILRHRSCEHGMAREGWACTALVLQPGHATVTAESRAGACGEAHGSLPQRWGAQRPQTRSAALPPQAARRHSTWREVQCFAPRGAILARWGTSFELEGKEAGDELCVV